MEFKLHFELATEVVKKLPDKPSNDELLKLYGLYKQATIGDVNTSKPSFWDVKGKAKYEAWSQNKGMTQSEAKEQYINMVQFLLVKQNVTDIDNQ